MTFNVNNDNNNYYYNNKMYWVTGYGVCKWWYYARDNGLLCHVLTILCVALFPVYMYIRAFCFTTITNVSFITNNNNNATKSSFLRCLESVLSLAKNELYPHIHTRTHTNGVAKILGFQRILKCTTPAEFVLVCADQEKGKDKGRPEQSDRTHFNCVGVIIFGNFTWQINKI